MAKHPNELAREQFDRMAASMGDHALPLNIPEPEESQAPEPPRQQEDPEAEPKRSPFAVFGGRIAFKGRRRGTGSGSRPRAESPTGRSESPALDEPRDASPEPPPAPPRDQPEAAALESTPSPQDTTPKAEPKGIVGSPQRPDSNPREANPYERQQAQRREQYEARQKTRQRRLARPDATLPVEVDKAIDSLEGFTESDRDQVRANARHAIASGDRTPDDVWDDLRALMGGDSSGAGPRGDSEADGEAVRRVMREELASPEWADRLARAVVERLMEIP